MNKIKQCLGILLLSLTVVSCRQKVVSPVPVDALPPIWPDYAGVTIPATIAPLNFRVTADGAEAVDVVISGKKGDPIRTSGESVEIPAGNGASCWRTIKGTALK